MSPTLQTYVHDFTDGNRCILSMDFCDKKPFADFYSKLELASLIEQYYQQAEHGLTIEQTNPHATLLIELITKLKNRQW